MPQLPLKYRDPEPASASRDSDIEPTNDAAETCSEKLSLNVYDLNNLDSLLRAKLLGGKLDKDNPVLIDRNDESETAIILTADLLVSATVCDIIRSEDRRLNETPTRVYLHRNGSWTKLPRSVLLTIIENGKVILNPEIFTQEIIITPLVPKETEKVSIGKRVIMGTKKSLLHGD